jgi:hypothetical protein
MKKVMRTMVRSTMTPVQTRNVSQSVAYRVVGLTWVINAAWYPLLSCKLALRGNFSLGHVTNCKTIIFDTVMDDVTLISARLCGLMTY